MQGLRRYIKAQLSPEDTLVRTGLGGEMCLVSKHLAELSQRCSVAFWTLWLYQCCSLSAGEQSCSDHAFWEYQESAKVT